MDRCSRPLHLEVVDNQAHVIGSTQSGILLALSADDASVIAFRGGP